MHWIRETLEIEHDSSEVGEAQARQGPAIINVTLAAIIAGDHLVRSYPRTCCFPTPFTNYHHHHSWIIPLLFSRAARAIPLPIPNG